MESSSQRKFTGNNARFFPAKRPSSATGKHSSDSTSDSASAAFYSDAARSKSASPGSLPDRPHYRPKRKEELNPQNFCVDLKREVNDKIKNGSKDLLDKNISSTLEHLISEKSTHPFLREQKEEIMELITDYSSIINDQPESSDPERLEWEKKRIVFAYRLRGIAHRREKKWYSSIFAKLLLYALTATFLSLFLVAIASYGTGFYLLGASGTLSTLVSTGWTALVSYKWSVLIPTVFGIVDELGLQALFFSEPRSQISAREGLVLAEKNFQESLESLAETTNRSAENMLENNFETLYLNVKLSTLSSTESKKILKEEAVGQLRLLKSKLHALYHEKSSSVDLKCYLYLALFILNDIVHSCNSSRQSDLEKKEFNKEDFERIYRTALDGIALSAPPPEGFRNFIIMGFYSYLPTIARCVVTAAVLMIIPISIGGIGALLFTLAGATINAFIKKFKECAVSIFNTLSENSAPAPSTITSFLSRELTSPLIDFSPLLEALDKAYTRSVFGQSLTSTPRKPSVDQRSILNSKSLVETLENEEILKRVQERHPPAARRPVPGSKSTPRRFTRQPKFDSSSSRSSSSTPSHSRSSSPKR